MKKRYIQLIQILLESTGGKSGSELSSRLGVSARTIRSDVKNFNEIYKKHATISSDMRKGYYIAEKQKKAFYTLLQEDTKQEDIIVPNTPSERIRFILLKLFFEARYVTMEQIAEELYVSKSTVNGDIKKVTECIEKYGFHVKLEVSQKSGLKLEGKESVKRKFLSNYLAGEGLHIELLHRIFRMLGIDIEKKFYTIFNEVLLFFEKREVYFTDGSLMLAAFEIFLGGYQAEQGKHIEEDYHTSTKAIVSDLEDFFVILEHRTDVIFSLADKRFLGDCLNLKRVFNRTGQIDMGDSAPEITRRFLESIQKQYGMDLSGNEEVLSTLAVHISSMLNRLKMGILPETEILEATKSQHPFAFDLATCIIPIINEAYGYDIHEIEIVYLSVYIEVLLNQYQRKYKVVVICGSGMGVSRMLVSKLNGAFKDKLEILGCYPGYLAERVLEVEKRNVDLVVSAVPLQADIDVPIVQVSPLFTEEDVSRLKRYLPFVLSKEKSIGRQNQKILELLDEELFFVMEENEDEEILMTVCEKLYDKGYIRSAAQFYRSIQKREELLSTRYKRVWLPHPLECMSLKTRCCIVLNRKKREVVFLMAVKGEDAQYLQHLYDKIIALMDDEDWVLRLLEMESFEAFINMFLQEKEEQ